MTAPLDTRLRRLRLGYMAQALEAQNAESLRQKHSYLEFLEALVDGELGTRENKSLMKRIKAAHFPVLKALAEFDFDFQPKLDVKLIKTLATCDFIEKKDTAILVGQPGTGKTHASRSTSSPTW
jgi:DNA replication protein DnaC